MKHEKIVVASDQVSTPFVRSLGICLLVGLGCWTALITALV